MVHSQVARRAKVRPRMDILGINAFHGDALGNWVLSRPV
jgi:hypothetical protein